MDSDLMQFTAEAGRQMMGGSQGHRVGLGKILFCDNLLHTDELCYSFMNALHHHVLIFYELSD